MTAFLLRRLMASVLVLVAVTFVVFLIVYLSPGDPVKALLGQSATAEQIAGMRTKLGLDLPFHEQYAAWLWRVVQGDFGRSISTQIPAMSILVPAFCNTLILAVSSLFISLLFGVLIGVVSGFRAGRLIDKILMFVTEVLAATPVFWLGLMLIWIFARELGWLPSSGMRNMRARGSNLDLIAHLVLPSIAASVLAISIIARLVRGAVIDVLASDYVKIAQAAGMSSFRIFRKQVWRNILPPIISVGGLQFGTLFGGVIFVETVFAWPGISAQLFNAITAGDVAVIQAGVLMIAATFVAINLVVDVVLVWLNPRGTLA